MATWIVKRGTQQHQVNDTATLVRLAEGRRLKSTDEVFHPIMQQWLNAPAVPEISHVFENTTAAVQGDSDAPPAVKPTEAQASSELTSSAVVQSSANVSQAWGQLSRLAGVIGGGVAIFGGVTLVGLKAASENSLIEAVAHGLGIYCIGKGLFMIAAIGNLQAAVDFVARNIRR